MSSSAIYERNVQAAAYANSAAGGTLVFYDGSIPADADTALGGGNHALCTITLPNPCFGAPAAGIITKAGSWLGVVTVAGTPTFFRKYTSGADTLMQGTVGSSTEDMVFDAGDLSWEIDDTVVIGAFTYTVPA